MDYKQVVERLQEANASKRDFLADSRHLAMFADVGEVKLAVTVERNGDNGELALKELLERPLGTVASLSAMTGILDQAHQQIAEKFDIPGKYYNRLRAYPELLAQNVNHWFAESPKRLLVRTACGNTRAVLSDHFRPIDHLDLLPLILSRLEAFREAEVDRCDLDDRRMYITVRNPAMRTGIEDVGDIVQAGFILSNSETGHAALSIQPRLWRLRCRNGLIMEDASLRRTHLGRTLTEEMLYRTETKEHENANVLEKAADIVDTVFDANRFRALTDQLRQTVAQEVPRPVEVVTGLGEALGFSEDIRKTILNRFMGESRSQYGLIQAVTATGRDLQEGGNGDFDQGIELEKLGGRLSAIPGDVIREIGEDKYPKETAEAALAAYAKN